MRPLEKYEGSLLKVEDIYEDIKGLLAGKSLSELLAQMQELVGYLDKSSAELKRIFNAQGTFKHKMCRYGKD